MTIPMQTYDVLIVGGGLSGLSVAHFLSILKPELKVVIVEKEAHPGGCIQTFNAEGIQAEWGPHGFLNNTPESLELLNNLGLDKNMQQAPLGNFLRYLCHNNKLVALPQSPQKLLATPLLSFPGKLRLLADLWKTPKDEDQTIADWAAYRFGEGVLPMIDAAVTGTFAGDMNKLSIDSVMPGVRDLEKENGSVLRGMIKSKKQKKSPSKGLPSMLNFPHGMEQFPAALAKGKEILFGNAVEKLEKYDDHWNSISGPQKIQARSVVIALPLNNALRILAPFNKPPVDEIPTAKIINVVMAFSETARIPYGFGYLAPAKENRFALGAMFSSHMFPGRVPAGNGLLEVLVGGRRHPERLELDDKDLLQKTFEDVSRLIELPDKPWFSKVLRPHSGIPQLEMDHPALLSWRNDLEKKYNNLHVCGFGWDGVGMNEMVKSAKKTALKLVEGSKEDEGKSQRVKPVYF